MIPFEEIIKSGTATTEDALKIFDRSEPVNIDFMIGTWKGYSFPTNHPFDGLLEATGWYGKSFLSSEKVHPLLFYTRGKKDVFAVNPALVPLKLPKPKNILARLLLLAGRPIMQTNQPKARLRMIEYRGKVSTCMIYDHKPIIDIYRKINAQTVLGLMDLKGMSQPYFFLLQKE